VSIIVQPPKKKDEWGREGAESGSSRASSSQAGTLAGTSLESMDMAAAGGSDLVNMGQLLGGLLPEGGAGPPDFLPCTEGVDVAAMMMMLPMKRDEGAIGRGRQMAGAAKPKYRFTHAQSVACLKKFDAWGGSVKGKKKEVVELAEKLGLTPSQIKKRFDYLKQRKLKSHLDGGGTKKIVEVAVEDVQVRGFCVPRQAPALCVLPSTVQSYTPPSIDLTHPPAPLRAFLPLQSAILAKEAGAHRVEVQASLTEGGVTASIGLVSQIVRALRKRPKVKVFALCRPRTGDFVYSSHEFEVRHTPISPYRFVLPMTLFSRGAGAEEGHSGDEGGGGGRGHVRRAAARPLHRLPPLPRTGHAGPAPERHLHQSL
jgi:hypothetical protein